MLILFGGLVTNTGAALAVPDWPTTFGYNMFLFPWSRMVGGIFYEHSHRLMGALVGLLTLALAAALWREGGRLRRLGLAARSRPSSPRACSGGLRVVLLPGHAGDLPRAVWRRPSSRLLAAIALLTAPRARASLAHRRPGR